MAHSCGCCIASASLATAPVIDLGPSLPRAYAPSLDKRMCAGKPCPCLVPAAACDAPGLTLPVCHVGHLPAHSLAPLASQASLTNLRFEDRILENFSKLVTQH